MKNKKYFVNSDMERDMTVHESGEKLHFNDHKKWLGLFKDETNGDPIVEFVGHRAKMYSLLTASDTHKMTAKGVGKVQQRQITHQDFLNCLDVWENTSGQHSHIVRGATKLTIQKHHIYLSEYTKVGLNSFDDKKYYYDVSKEGLCFGHKNI